MNKILIAIPVSLAVGFAAAVLIKPDTSPVGAAVDQQQSSSSVSFDQTASLEQRIRSLERAVSDERQARQLLQEEMLWLTMDMESRSDTPPVPEADESAAPAVRESRESRRAEYMRRNSPEGRRERLVEGGFPPGQADWIVQRESELQMSALQARYDAQRDGTPFDYSQGRYESDQALRGELGDADYERYLDANGRSTNISISNVMESSPAQRAGLQIGDQIVRYDGARVFSMSDLNDQTMQGDPGISIAVDIVRDGIPMQVVVPRGPVGISAGRRYSR